MPSNHNFERLPTATIFLFLSLLNGVCPQASCNNCAQPTYINPQVSSVLFKGNAQSVVLTVPVRQLPQANRISVSNPAIITHASGPCCNQQNPQVQSVTWINQGGSWNANNSPGSLPSSNYQNPLFPIQTPPNRTQSPLTQSTSRTTSFTSSPQGIYNYNNVNAGFSTTPSPITVTNSYNYQNDQYNSESPGNNYNNANGEYNTQSPPSESSYNNLNDGYNQQPQSNNNNNNYNNVNGNYNTQQPPFMTNDYNNANAAYNTQQPQATNNNQYNAANDGYNAESQNTGFPYQSSTFSPAYNAPNDAFNANAGFDASYNNANANYDSNQFGPTSQAPNAQTGDYINTFEGTFVEPANSEANSQSYNANQGFGASTPSPIAPLYPSQQINQTIARSKLSVQTAQDSYQGQGSQQQPNDQSPTNNYQYQASTAPNDNFNQGSTPFAYSTVNPNANFNPSAQYPVTATADFNQQPTNFDYSTTYNPNSGYNSNTGFTQSPQNYQGSTIGSQGINVSPLNDPQTTPNYFNNNNNNNNDDGASAAGVGMAGSMPIGSSTYAPTSTTVQQTFPTSTVTPFGQDASGQFVQPSASSTGQTTQGFYSLTSPTPMNTNGQQGAQTTGFTQQPSSVATNSGLPSAQHTDMNYQYSQGVGGDGSTQQMGTSLPFTGNTQRTSTAQTQSPFDSTLNADAQASRLYDHGDMNTIYGNYNSTTAGSTAGPTEAALQRDEPLTQSFAATSTFTAFAIALLSTLLF